MDGRLCVWDIKSGKRPVTTMHAPDNRWENVTQCSLLANAGQPYCALSYLILLRRPILKMAVHHDGLVGFCTQTGTFMVARHDSAAAFHGSYGDVICRALCSKRVP